MNIHEEIRKKKQWLYYHTQIKPSLYLTYQQLTESESHRKSSKLQKIQRNFNQTQNNVVYRPKGQTIKNEQPLKHFYDHEFEFNLYTHQANAIQRIKPAFYNYLLRLRLRKLIQQMKNEKIMGSVIIIQKNYKAYKLMKQTKYLGVVSRIIIQREEAARFITGQLRQVITYRRSRYLMLLTLIASTRLKVATIIQKNYKTYKAKQRLRAVLKLEKGHPSIVWQGVAENVYIIGEMNNWEDKIQLKYCQLRKIFIRYFQGLKQGAEYEVKFIVDGSYQLSSKYHVIESYDRGKGMVNVFEVTTSDIQKNSYLQSVQSYTTITSIDDGPQQFQQQHQWTLLQHNNNNHKSIKERIDNEIDEESEEEEDDNESGGSISSFSFV